MKPLDFQKNLLATARILFQPPQLISLALHGVVLLLPISSDLNVKQSKLPRQYKQVKIAQLPTTQPSPKPSFQTSSKLNPQPSPQPSQSTPLDLPIPLQSPWQPNPQPRQSTSLNLPASPNSVTFPKQSPTSSMPIRESISQPQQQSKKEETQQQPPEQPKRPPSNQEPTESSPSNQQPNQSPSTQESTQSPQPPQQPAPSSQPNQEQGKNDSGGGGEYSEFFKKNQDDIILLTAIGQVKQSRGDKLQEFKTEQDFNKLTEPDKFKDATGKPDTRFSFLQKAMTPLTTQDISSALEAQLKSLEFSFDKKGTYGGGPFYEVTKGDFKRYVILAPGKDEQGNLTAVIVSQDYPR